MNRQSFALALCLLFIGCSLHPMGAAVPTEPLKADVASPITEITLQRTWCYGSCPIDEVVLRADGTAAFTGKANVGRTGQFKGKFRKGEFKGKFRKGEFEQLARWLDSQGFSTMNDNPEFVFTDASRHIISVVRGGKRKSVMTQIEVSLAFWGMERAIRGVASDIAWQPESSGIKGIATRKPGTFTETPGTTAAGALSNNNVMVRLAGDNHEFQLRTDENGRFEIALRPGAYTVEIPHFGRNSRMVTSQQKVTVQPDKFSEVSFTIDRMAE